MKYFLLTLGALIIVIGGITVFLWWRGQNLFPAASPAPTVILPADQEFFPTGETTTTISNPVPSTLEVGGETGEESSAEATSFEGPLVNFIKISGQPIAGFFVPVSATSSADQVFYLKRAGGHIFRNDPLHHTTIRLSNTTLPAVYEASGVVADQELRLILRYLKDGRPQNLITRLPLPETDPEESFLDERDLPPLAPGKLLSSNLLDLAWSPDQQQIFYLAKTATGSAGFITDLLAENPRQVFSSPFAEWQTAWLEPTGILLWTKPSGRAEGFLYLLNPETGALHKLLGGLLGLSVVIGPDPNLILYSRHAENQPTLYLLDRSSTRSFELPLKTLAEKCAFSTDGALLFCGVPQTPPAADYPDAWYRGEINTTDNLWRLDVASRRAEIIFNADLAKIETPLDVWGISPSPDNTILYLFNKNDSNLWALRLETSF